MRRGWWLIVCLVAVSVVSCKKVTVDFSYSPANPKAGETVTFDNLSTGGEDYVWYFGDNSSVDTKNASHVYKQVGTYVVTLKESKSKKTVSRTVIVTDTVPTFAADTDSICMFVPVKLTATVWNPYAHPVSYRWVLGEQVRLKSGQLTDAGIEVYFAKAGTETVRLEITMDGITTDAKREFTIYNTPAYAILMQDEQGNRYSQRMYADEETEDPQAVDYTRGNQLLDEWKDTLRYEDTLERKVYEGGAYGLRVSNKNGTCPKMITEDAVTCFTLNASLNRLVYATSAGVYSMPLIHTEDNQYVFVPKRINSFTVKRLVIDEVKH